MLGRSICLIVNPTAGGGRAGRVAGSVVKALTARGLQVRRVDSLDLPHAQALAGEAARADEAVVTLSGDGTVGAVAQVLREIPGALLGVLPGGRGNDLARVLNIPRDPVRACEVIAKGVPRALDLGIAGDRAFVGIASVGFDSEANRIANEAPPWLGRLVYAYGLVRALRNWRPARFQIELQRPGELERVTFSGYSVAAANSRAYGGGMLLAPDAVLDDGLLDVVIIQRTSRRRFLALSPSVFRGEHLRQPVVRVLRAASLRIEADRPFTLYADGDPVAKLPLRVTVDRRAVRVLVPAGANGAQAFSSVPAVGR